MGKYVDKVSTSYNIDLSSIPEKGWRTCQLIGNWKDNHVFYEITGDKLENETFWLINKDGKLLSKKSISNNNVTFGEGYYEDVPSDYRRVRNGNLYVLGSKGKYALITEVPLASFFGK